MTFVFWEDFHDEYSDYQVIADEIARLLGEMTQAPEMFSTCPTDWLITSRLIMKPLAVASARITGRCRLAIGDDSSYTTAAASAAENFRRVVEPFVDTWTEAEDKRRIK